MQTLAGRDADITAGGAIGDPVEENGVLPHPGISAD